MSEAAEQLGAAAAVGADAAPVVVEPGAVPPVAQEPAPPVPSWLEGVADDLRNDPDVNRYLTAEDAAKGIKETRTWARGRIPLPAADDEAGWAELGQKLRPTEAKDYTIPVPDGIGPEMAEAFRAKAFEIGMPARHAQAVAEFFNQTQSDALSRLTQANTDELKGLELELGVAGYNQRLEAVANMLTAAGVPDFVPTIDGLQTAMEKDGSAAGGKVLRLLFAMAERTGELGKVDPTAVNLRMGAMSPEQAATKAREMVNDSNLTKQMADPNSQERKTYAALMAQAGKR